MEAAAASRTTLCALPLALLQSVLARLPVDARARACEVCRAWNAALAERSLWTVCVVANVRRPCGRLFCGGAH
jgi:hypothetical protein